MTLGQCLLCVCIGAPGVCVCVGVCVAEVWGYVGMTSEHGFFYICIGASGVCVCTCVWVRVRLKCGGTFV